VLSKTILSCALLLVSLACTDSSEQRIKPSLQAADNVMTPRISIRLGEAGPDFAKRYAGAVRVTHSTPNVDHYSMRWDSPPRAQVHVEHGRNTFAIDDVFGVLSMQELRALPSEGLKTFSINAGVSAPEFISHDEARLAIHAILRRLLDAEWKPVVSRSRPRLSGQARLDYCLNVSDSIGLDPTHLPTFADWMRIPSRTAWNFYADGLYLDVSFTREPTYTDPQKPGAYLVTFNLQTETEYVRGYAGPDNRLRWKEFVQPELDKAAAQRASKEAELASKGVHLDLSYRDPPVPPLQ
jgi:hypothetical protein